MILPYYLQENAAERLRDAEINSVIPIFGKMIQAVKPHDSLKCALCNRCVFGETKSAAIKNGDEMTQCPMISACTAKNRRDRESVLFIEVKIRQTREKSD